MKVCKLFQCVVPFLVIMQMGSASASVRLKELVRIEGVRDNSLVGYGLVVGLAGTGDSRRNDATLQSIVNTLRSFDIRVKDEDISSRNVAAVMITAQLPPFIQPGNKIDITLASMGDARSLLGGTLFLTPLKAANGEVYALAQGPVAVGGYQYSLNGNQVQKNHPTVGSIPDGATVEREVPTSLVNQAGAINILLSDPDFTTANRIKKTLRETFPAMAVQASGPGKISVTPESNTDLLELVAQIENLEITPDQEARVIVNERTGTVVSGGNVRISAVNISHGNIEVRIQTDFSVSQPENLTLFNVGASSDIRTAIIPKTRINLEEQGLASVDLQEGSTINDLVKALKQIKVSTRDLISILQAIKSSGALHARLIIN